MVTPDDDSPDSASEENNQAHKSTSFTQENNNNNECSLSSHPSKDSNIMNTPDTIPVPSVEQTELHNNQVINKESMNNNNTNLTNLNNNMNISYNNNDNASPLFCVSCFLRKSSSDYKRYILYKNNKTMLFIE